jgi:PAS domain S-box-containing protein
VSGGRQEEVRKLLQAVEQSANSILITDTRGLITYVNPAFEKTYGHSRDSVLGQTPRFLKSGEHDRSFYEQFWKKLLGGESVRQEFVNRKKNGELVTVEAVVSPVFDARQKLVGYIGVQDDVTERKRAQRALQESEERFRRAFSASPVGMTISESATGLILDANERFARMLGYSRDELIGRTSLGLGIWADPNERERVVEAVESSLPVREFHARFRTKTGDIRDVLDSVEPLLMGSKRVLLSAFQDVTDLRKSEQRFARAFHANPVPTSISEAETGRILDVNDQFLKVLGYSRAELLGRSSTDLGIWAKAEDRLRVGDRVLAEGAVYNQEVSLRTGSGDIRSVVGSIVGIQLGSISCMLSTFVDITERKRADEALRASEQRVRALMENARDAIFVSATTGTVLEVNRAAEELTGRPRGEIVGRPVWETVPEEDRAAVGISFRKTIDDASLEGFETRILRPDGTCRPAEVSASLVDVGGTQVVHAIVRDISDRKKADEAIRDSEERYRLLFEANPRAMWVFDQETLAFLAVNDATCRHYGYSRDEFLRMTILDIRRSEDVPELLRLLESEQPEYRESGVWPHRKKDGSLMSVEISSHPFLFDGRPSQLVLAVDVTERLRAEDEKREIEERYRVIFDASPLPTWLFETPSLKIYDVNRAAIDFYGYSREEFRSMTLYDLRSPAEAERLRAMYAETPRPEVRWNPGVWEHRKKDGTLALMDIHTHAVQVGGRPMRLAVQIDVTGQRRLEDQLRQSQKMEAVGQLAGGIAHDFNNILTTILGYSGLALERVNRQDPLSEEILEIQRAGERAAELTKKLLAFSRKQILEPRVIDLNETVSGVERMLRRTIGENVRLLFRPAPGLGRVRADPSQVEQVLLNLAVNARDAMPAGGFLTIETANVELDGEFAQTHPELKMSGEFVVLAVSDSGTGMDEATKARIFEPFFTTKELGKGTGLGLSTVYGIVKQSGGYVWCYSEPGAGTAFKIYLPRVAEEAGTIAPRPASLDLRGSETILLVEDEETLANLARRVLLKHGYRVLTASSGATAREVAAEQPGIDLLLTDVVMPGMSGRELADELQRRFPDLKVLFMSGYTDDAIVHQGFLDPGLAFLQKPFTPYGLAKKVREVLRRAS